MNLEHSSQACVNIKNKNATRTGNKRLNTKRIHQAEYET